MRDYDGDVNYTVSVDGDISSHQLDGDLKSETILDGELSAETVIDGELSSDTEADGELGIVFEVVGGGGEGIPYTGETTVTPTTETQILPTSGYTLNKNIVVNPIPSNYGLITWNGRTLTVS